MLTATLVYHFFITQKYPIDNLFFIHCNHNTRSGNTKDEAFIRAFFAGTQLTISTRKSKQKLNEAKLRERRYGEFKKHIKKYNIQKILF
jgi:tRNA(Ile)-lysidine synthase TilS/MesJ